MRGSALEDQVVAVFDLREEQAVFTAGVFSLSPGEEGCQAGQPFLAARHQVTSGERIGEFLKPFGCRAFEESIGALLEPDALLTHPVGQPVMLVDADPGREGEVETHANKHASPAGIVDIDVVLNDPTL
jgi:hypothetical protein